MGQANLLQKRLCHLKAECGYSSNPMGIACPRYVHRTSLLGPSIHVPYCTSIGRPFSVHCSRVDRKLSGSSMDVQRLHKVEHQISHM